MCVWEILSLAAYVKSFFWFWLVAVSFVVFSLGVDRIQTNKSKALHSGNSFSIVELVPLSLLPPRRK